MKILMIAGLLTAIAEGQTQVDVKAQTRNVNFSGAIFVIPFPTGTALPATCTVGSMFFNSGSAVGSNLYGCVATNTWVLESGGTSGGSNGPSGIDLTAVQ